MRKLKSALLGALLLLAAGVPVGASEAEDLLGRDTPRGTIEGWLAAVDGGDYETAARYLDLRNLSEDVTRYTPEQIAFGVSIVLQRALWLDTDRFSTSSEGEEDDGLPSYRDELGRVRTDEGELQLFLQRVPDGEGNRIWKVSNATIREMPRLFEDYRYNRYVEWLRTSVPRGSTLGLEWFKWMAALGYALAAAPLVLLFLWGLSRFLFASEHPLHHQLRRLLMRPVAALVVLQVFSYTVLDLGLGQQAQEISQSRTLTIFLSLWLIWEAVGLGREAYAQFLIRRGREASVPLLQPLASAMRVGFLLFGLVIWLDNLGYEITALLTGLGIGGVAVALVLQKPLEDVFGAITLYTQQPIRIGDFGRFGDITGTVEEISLRTTRIRTLDNTVVAIPNMRLAAEPIENISARRKILYKQALRISHDTTPAQMRTLQAGIEALLAANEHVIDEGARVRFIAIAAEGFEIAIWAYVDVTEWPRFLEVSEALNYAVVDLLEALEVQLVSPLSAALASNSSA